MRGDRLGWAALAGVGLAVGAAPGIARAEGAPILLEEIVISAQKRPQDLAEIPASVAVVEGADLSPAGARREDELARLPNLSAQPVTAKLYASFVAIRGVGSALIESDPAVGLNIDGISLGSSQAFSGSLLDVDRIEVMRGPQGALYGRLALGWATAGGWLFRPHRRGIRQGRSAKSCLSRPLWICDAQRQPKAISSNL